MTEYDVVGVCEALVEAQALPEFLFVPFHTNLPTVILPGYNTLACRVVSTKRQRSVLKASKIASWRRNYPHVAALRFSGGCRANAAHCRPCRTCYFAPIICASGRNGVCPTVGGAAQQTAFR